MKRRVVLSIAAVLGLAACGDDLPQGPGNVQATVDVGATAVGAIVLHVSGVELGPITGVGSTRAFASEAVSASKRVVLVTGQSGALHFSVHQGDRSLGPPTATVVEAIGLDNQPITDISGITVRFSDD